MDFQNLRKAGKFVLKSGDECEGELSLEGPATLLDLYSSSPISVSSHEDIHGALLDRSKVSLLNCVITSGTGSSHKNKEIHYFTKLFPHIVVFGDEHVSYSKGTIQKVSFCIDDAPILFDDFDSFGMPMRNANEHLKRMLSEKEHAREVEIGDFPLIFYFTGKHQIFSVSTVIGTISASHGPSFSMPGPEGIHLKNEIRIQIEFEKLQSVRNIVGYLYDVLRFFEIIIGRPQNVSSLTFLPICEEGEYGILNAYWCIPPERNNENHAATPHPVDLPIQAALEPDEFSEVLRRWVERNEDWASSRERFASTFSHGNYYSIDRVIAAANMFDILPASAYRGKREIFPELEEARKVAQQVFGALPTSHERNSVLSVLGRLGSPSLRSKVLDRCDVIDEAMPHLLPDIDLVIGEAVSCRNYYVHGSEGRIDYEKNRNLVHFFVNTLEFVFAVSDLLDSGWNIRKWVKKGVRISHPFALYLSNYERRLSLLKNAIATSTLDGK